MHHQQLGADPHCTALLCFVSVASNYNYYDGEMNPKWENLIELFNFVSLLLAHWNAAACFGLRVNTSLARVMDGFSLESDKSDSQDDCHNNFHGLIVGHGGLVHVPQSRCESSTEFSFKLHFTLNQMTTHHHLMSHNYYYYYCNASFHSWRRVDGTVYEFNYIILTCVCTVNGPLN